MNKQLKTLILFIVIFVNFYAFSLWALDFQHDLNYADSLKNSVNNSGAHFSPQKTFKDYTKRPAQTKYFSGVTQNGDNNMDSNASSGVMQDKSGAMVENAFKTRPVFKINPNSEAMQKSKLIKNDAYNISHGISDKYVDCKKAQVCQTTYKKQTCDEGTRVFEKSCTKTAVITLLPECIYEGFSHHVNNFLFTTTVPADGIIAGVHIVLDFAPGFWRDGTTFKGFLNGIFIATAVSDSNVQNKYLRGELKFDNNNRLNIHVKKGERLSFSIEGDKWLNKANLRDAGYCLWLLMPRKENYFRVSWQEDCNNGN